MRRVKSGAAKRIYRFADLEAAGVDFTLKHLTTLENRDQFPKRIRLGLNSIGWIATEIDSWIDEKIRLSRLKDEAKDQQKERGRPDGRGRIAGSRVELDATGKRRVIPPAAAVDRAAAARGGHAAN